MTLGAAVGPADEVAAVAGAAPFAAAELTLTLGPDAVALTDVEVTDDASAAIVVALQDAGLLFSVELTVAAGATCAAPFVATEVTVTPSPDTGRAFEVAVEVGAAPVIEVALTVT